jgi:hypothetical protein
VTTGNWSLRRLHTLDEAQIGGLADVLIDCVEGGASVGFMLPLARDHALAFWHRVAMLVPQIVKGRSVSARYASRLARASSGRSPHRRGTRTRSPANRIDSGSDGIPTAASAANRF